MSLPTTVRLDQLGFYLPDGVAVMAHDVRLDLDVDGTLAIELRVRFERIFAELVEESGVFEAVELPRFNAFVDTGLALELRGRPEALAPFGTLFSEAADPPELFVLGPKRPGDDHSPLHDLASYELRGWSVVSRQTGTDAEVAYATKDPEPF